MYQPDELKKLDSLTWSYGAGVDVWGMIAAAISGDVEALRRLLSKDPGLISCHYEYRTPLYFAVRGNRLEAARFLLERGADQLWLAVNDSFAVTARDRGFTEMEALLTANLVSAHGIVPGGEEVAAAIRAGDLPKLRALLDASPELVHAAEAHGNRPIHMAVMMRRVDAIDELLARGANLEAQRMDGARPIQLANGDYFFRGWRDAPDDVTATPADVIAHLRAKGAHCDICTASHIGDLARVQELLAADPALANRPSAYITYYPCSGTPLRNAAGGGHMEIVKLLVENGADPNLREEHIAPHGFALHAAVGNGHLEIVKLLLEKGARANVEVESSADTLSAVIRKGHQPMIDLLTSYGAARRVHLLAYYGDVPTAAAVFAGNPKLADDPEALANAAGEGHEAFVKLMLRYQPDLPKRVGCAATTRELTELLFAHGMNANHVNWLGIAPLHQFARSGDIKNAGLFLDQGADINAIDEDLRSTPLAWAAKAGQTLMVEFLLRRGASLGSPHDQENPGRVMPLDWFAPLAWARRRGQIEIVQLLGTFERDGRLPPGDLEPFEKIVSDLVFAYGKGDPEALRRLTATYQFKKTLTRDLVQEIVRQRLGKPPDDTLTVDEARYMVARSRSFENWDDLVRHTTAST